MRTRLEKDARRQQLVEAATRVFARSGYAAADVADIVAEAGVTRGTFYLYFPTKRDIFAAVIERYLDLIGRQAATLPLPPGLSLRDQFAHAFAQALRWQADHRDLALVALRDGWGADPALTEHLRAAGDRAKASLAATYDRLIAAGHLRPCASRLAASAVGGLLREVALHEVLLGGRTDIDVIAAELAAFVYDGLRPDRSGG
jgi:AcrR family transcriptional regulator